jgi:hypothetical protein
MSNESRPRPVMTVAFVLLLVFAAVVALLVTALASDFHSSDAAGNGMAQGFAYLGAIVFWVVVGVLLILCGVRSGFGAARVLAVVFALAIAVTSQFMAMSLLEDMSGGDPYEKLLWASVGVVAFAFVLYLGWAFFPPLHRLPAMAANVGFGVIDQAKVKEIQALSPETPFSAFLPYTELDPSKSSDARQAALDRMKATPKKQAEVEGLLAQGDTRVLRVLRNLEVEVTPQLCAGGKKAAVLVAEELKPRAGRNTFEELEPKMNGYMDGMQWLNETGCDMKPEFGLLEQTVRMYPDSFPRQWSLDWLLELQGKPRQP